MTNKAIFLDRDGVLIEDQGYLFNKSDIRIFPQAYEALRILNQLQYKLVVVTNQPVVARGLCTTPMLDDIHNELKIELHRNSGVFLDAIYYCPHHPNADLNEWRLDCDCRKPKSGLLLQASRDHHIDLKQSYMIGDRLSDIVAGYNVGCRTILVHSPQTQDPLIESSLSYEGIQPNQECTNLLEAALLVKEFVL